MTRARVKARKLLAHYAKAIVAFFAPTLANLAVQLQKIAARDPVDWLAFVADVGIYLLGAAVVWAVPNKTDA